MPDLAIKTEDLSKTYRGDLGKRPVVGLENLSLEVERGEVYAFLGPNGAGKTTTIKVLTRLLFPDRGRVWLLGTQNTSASSMERVGYLPEQPSLYGYLSGREFLDFIGRLFRFDRARRHGRIEGLLDRVGLRGRGDDAVRGYSRGMMQRLGMAQALMNEPDLLILDEPMASLDPVGRKDFRDLILSLKGEGTTIFFSSHILADAEMIADRVCILDRGRVVRTGTLGEILGGRTGPVEIVFDLDPEKQDRVAIGGGGVTISGRRIMVRLESGEDLGTILERIRGWGGTIVSVVPQKRTLEEFFLSELGR